jgi:hypothetical protein
LRDDTVTGLENSNRISPEERAVTPRNTGVSALEPRTFCRACSVEQVQAENPRIDRMIPHKIDVFIFDIIASTRNMRRRNFLL